MLEFYFDYVITDGSCSGSLKTCFYTASSLQNALHLFYLDMFPTFTYQEIKIIDVRTCVNA